MSDIFSHQSEQQLSSICDNPISIIMSIVVISVTMILLIITKYWGNNDNL
jgi:hypothetical protein